MAIAGTLEYSTKIDKDGFNKGLKNIEGSVKSGGTKIKNIVSALGITKVIGTTMDTIKNSIGGAVSRIDTLNNFPRVMSNLGIASEDSEKAVKKLSDGLNGIPTTLDSASLSVQRFTSVNGDVNKSTDYFLALNNALLAGGASADIQSTAMEQLSQSYAKGKPDMIEWRSLQTAMPAQLKQVAQAFNMTTDELGEALRNGKLSMDDFMKKIVDLHKNGTGEFQSFAEQAKNSTGGIQTSISNAKTAITRGVANIVKAFDEALKSNGLGGISTVISNIGKIAEKVLKKVASLIPKIVAKIKDIYNWVIQNQNAIKNLIKVIASLVAGYKAYKAVNIVKELDLAKKATLLLNAAMSANPIGLVVAAVTALAAGLVFLVTKQIEAQKRAKEFAEQAQESRQKLEEYNKSIDDTTKANLSHIENVKKLKDELVTLVDENGKVKDGYKSRVDFILNELNGALGTEYKLNGDIIQNYKDLQTEIDKTIEKKKAEIILQGQEEKYKNAIEQQGEAIERLRKIQQQMGMSYDEVREKYGKYIDQVNNGVPIIRSQFKSKEEYEKVETLMDLVKAYDNTEKEIKDYTENVKTYEDNYAKFIERKYDEIGNTVTVKTQDWSSQSLQILTMSIKNQKDTLKDYQETHQRTGNKLAKQNAEQAQKNLSALALELGRRTSTIKELGFFERDAWRTLGQSSYEDYSMAISQMAPDMQQKIQEATGIIAAGTPQMAAEAEKLGTTTVNEFDKSAEAKQKALNTIMGYFNGLNDDQKRQLLQQVGIQDVDIVLDELNKGNLSEDHGKNILLGLWNGLKNGTIQGNIMKTAMGLAQKVNNAFTGKQGWDEHSPSKKMKKFAEYYIQPISDVMNKRKKKITNTATSLVSSINKSIIDEMNKAVAIETGSINAKAILQSNKEQPIVIARDQTINIDNKQVFEGKNQTPYEQQREAKQQLRRLAYGL